MTVITFQPRVAPLVESGEKRQTIRKPRNRPIKPGDALSLREWTGKPCRSPQRILVEAVCSSVHAVTIDEFGYVAVDGADIGVAKQEELARADGFSNYEELLQWFEKTHGLPFEGVLIMWETEA